MPAFARRCLIRSAAPARLERPERERLRRRADRAVCLCRRHPQLLPGPGRQRGLPAHGQAAALGERAAAPDRLPDRPRARRHDPRSPGRHGGRGGGRREPAVPAQDRGRPGEADGRSRSPGRSRCSCATTRSTSARWPRSRPAAPRWSWRAASMRLPRATRSIPAAPRPCPTRRSRSGGRRCCRVVEVRALRGRPGRDPLAAPAARAVRARDHQAQGQQHPGESRRDHRTSQSLSDGTPGQRSRCPSPVAHLGQTPTRRRRFHAELEIRVNGTRGREVESLFASTPADTHYATSIDEDDRLSVLFGDGRRGAVPPAGAEITAVYRIGLGARGNVGADTLSVFLTAVPRSPRSAIRFPAEGGADRESTEEAKIRARFCHRPEQGRSRSG